MAEPLTHIDEHSAEIDAEPAAAWEALARVVFAQPGGPVRVLGRLLGATRGELVGFRVARSDPPRLLELEGDHRFSRYRLRFELDALPGGRTRVSAVTDAAFPGAKGAVCRALVIRSRARTS